MYDEMMQEYQSFVEQIYSPMNLIILIVMVLSCFFFAAYGFKLLKIEVAIIGAVLGYAIGSGELALLVGDLIPFSGIDVVLGIILAIVGLLISTAVCKVAVFLYTAIMAFIFGTAIFSPFITGITGLAVADEIMIFVLSLLFGVVIATIVYKFFKPVFIVFSSLGNTSLAFGIIAMLITPTNMTVIGVATLVGLVLGIPAMIKQFKSCAGMEF